MIIASYSPVAILELTCDETGKTNTTAKTSIINKSEIPENITTSIQALLEYGEISNSTSAESSVDITIILGKDFGQAQMTKDEEIVFRVFEYGFGHAYKGRIVTGTEGILKFPEQRIIYLSENHL